MPSTRGSPPAQLTTRIIALQNKICHLQNKSRQQSLFINALPLLLQNKLQKGAERKRGATVSKMEMVKPSRKEITAQFLTGVKHWAVTFSLGMGYKPKLEV